MARAFYRYFPSYDPMCGGNDAGNCILVTKDWISNSAGHSYSGAIGGAGARSSTYAGGSAPAGGGAGRRSSVNTNFETFAIT